LSFSRCQPDHRADRQVQPVSRSPVVHEPSLPQNRSLNLDGRTMPVLRHLMNYRDCFRHGRGAALLDDVEGVACWWALLESYRWRSLKFPPSSRSDNHIPGPQADTTMASVSFCRSKQSSIAHQSFPVFLVGPAKLGRKQIVRLQHAEDLGRLRSKSSGTRGDGL
jgi:hypothetical protein